MATPKKPTTAPKIIPDEIEVDFVVGLDRDGNYAIREIHDDLNYNDAVQIEIPDYDTYQVCRVYLPRPKPPELTPLILVPQHG